MADCAASFEALEPRLLLSGNVLVTFSHGAVNIVSDRTEPGDNGIVVTVTDNGDGTSTVNVANDDDTTVNDGEEVEFDNVTGKVSISLGDGDDSVSVEGAWDTLPGALSIKTGAGDDYVNVDSVYVTGKTTIDTGTGDDQVDLDSEHTGDVTIKNAETVDADEIYVGDEDNASSLTITTEKRSETPAYIDVYGEIYGDLTITTGAADDDVDMDVDVAGDTSIDTGAGMDDDLYVEGWFGGDVTLKNAEDATDVEDAYIEGSLTINTGKATDGTSAYVWLDEVTVDGAVKITTGAGDDEVYLGWDYGCVFNGAVTVTTGNSVTVGSDTVYAEYSEFNGAVKLTTGANGSEVYILDSAFYGAFSLTTGSGDDYVEIEYDGDWTSPNGLLPEFTGPVTINTGAGDDTLSVEGYDTDGDELFFHGSTFNVNLGSGDDLLEGDYVKIFGRGKVDGGPGSEDTLSLGEDFTADLMSEPVNFEIFPV